MWKKPCIPQVVAQLLATTQYLFEMSQFVTVGRTCHVRQLGCFVGAPACDFHAVASDEHGGGRWNVHTASVAVRTDLDRERA